MSSHMIHERKVVVKDTVPVERKRIMLNCLEADPSLMPWREYAAYYTAVKYFGADKYGVVPTPLRGIEL